MNFATAIPIGLRHRDVMFALGLVFILTVLILPVPSWMLDIGLALSMAISVLILMVALWITRPLDFSSFPTVLLIATLLRLSLNLASTRLILSEGHGGTDAAGHVIMGFANFVIGGNFVIGLIVFAILVVVNFIVITKGASRIAEVGARFALDAMPGKQMAIDADLSAGLIDESQARHRRQELEQESAFFGAMDGASKFVRGDAVAGLIITAINVLGGLVIGVAQHGLPFGEAAHTYTVLTVGDGLITQIPALIVSLAAGILVSKGGNRGSVDEALLGQLGGYPKALAVAGGLMALLAVTPGLPMPPFLLLAAAAGGLAWHLPRYARQQEEAKKHEELLAAKAPTAEEPVADMLRVDDIRLELGSGLVSMILDPGTGLSAKVRRLRKRFATEFGFLLPSVRLRDSASVALNGYEISIQGVVVAKGEVQLRKMLAIDPRNQGINIPGLDTREPTFNLPARWIDPALTEEAELKGFTVVDPDSVVTTHMAEVVKEHMPTLLSYAATKRLLDELDREHQKLVADLVPGQVTLSVVQRVLQALLAERVSIRNLPIILEGISEAAAWTRNVTLMTEHVRSRLSLQICQALMTADGFIPVIVVSPEWETVFLENIVEEGEDRRFVMPPSQVQEFLLAARSRIQAHAGSDHWPAVLVAPAARPFVRSLLERVSPSTPVICHNELHRKAPVTTIDQI
ncbi:flagellar biosynthesis protein FlhA [Indioceanicola profundi]|uniref:flagellar biosynthesis protein FlhA n=1 Tax=Indioceanicola profundi TaxID=2220096 RepID=UPI000E6ACB43|nr:flagellar biosynthesis protein FlhA [Indioceanicola profundi]